MQPTMDNRLLAFIAGESKKTKLYFFNHVHINLTGRSEPVSDHFHPAGRPLVVVLPPPARADTNVYGRRRTDRRRTGIGERHGDGQGGNRAILIEAELQNSDSFSQANARVFR